MLNNTILYHNESHTHHKTHTTTAHAFLFNTQTTLKPIQIDMRSSIKKKECLAHNQLGITILIQ